jgi:prepilin-type N-terminal cleavage/methylation domain-containing protein
MFGQGAGAPRGFTLVEAVIVMVVAGFLMALALPRFAEVRRSIELDTAAYQLAGDLRRAQVEAIKRNEAVTLARTGASTYSISFIGNRTLEASVTFNVGSADSVRLASFGPPTTGAQAFTLDHGGFSKTVSVTAAGLVQVQ